jgi:two-component system phosphate regulon sensor histidine kinase PhoR
MNNEHWAAERWRIALVFFAALLGGMLSNQWLPCLVLALLGYIGWLLFKLHQLNRWLEEGADPKKAPDSDGVWDRVAYQIQDLQKKNSQRKKRMSKLLKRLQGIITGLPYATVVLNGNNEIDWANKQAADYLNINRKTDRGQRIENLLRVPAIHQALTKNTREEMELTLPQNEHRPLSLQLLPVHKNLKLLIAQDISEQTHSQQMRKNFIANASHELRTPLTVIAGYLEILAADKQLPEHLQPAVNAAAEQSARMHHIIEDLLTLSRLERMGLSHDSDNIIDVPTILRQLCDDESMLLNDSNHHTIGLNIDNTLKLKGAETEIISVFSNLIHNAIRHTPEKTHIRIQWKKHARGGAHFKVSDNGPGIPAAHLPHLTERFYRVDESRSQAQGGTGLGLAIVDHIVIRHGGKLKISSTMGKGTHFIVAFPVNRVIDD